MSAPTKVAAYAVLGFWTLVVLFPLYWVLITSFKAEVAGRQRALLPALRRFQADARRLALHAVAEQHARPLSQLGHRGALEHGARASLIGSLAAYALVRIRFQVKLAADRDLPRAPRRASSSRSPRFRCHWQVAARGRARALPARARHARAALQGARSATTTSSSGSSRTASCRRSSRCCRST